MTRYTKKDAREFEEWLEAELTRALGKGRAQELHNEKGKLTHRTCIWDLYFGGEGTDLPEHRLEVILPCESVEPGPIGRCSRSIMVNSRTGVIDAYPFNAARSVPHHKYQAHFYNATPLSEVKAQVINHMKPLGVELFAFRDRPR